MNKKFIIVLVIVIVVAAGWWALAKGLTTVIDKDTIIQGNYAVKSAHTLVLKNKAKLTVEGNFTNGGKVECQGGELVMIIHGGVNNNGSITCNRTEGNSVSGIRLAGSAFSFSKDSKLESNRSIQLAAREDLLADTPEKINALFDEAGKNSGVGKRIGPFSEGVSPTKNAYAPVVRVSAVNLSHVNSNEAVSSIFPVAHAQAGVPVVISGHIVVNRPPPGIHQVIVYNFPDASGVKIQDMNLTGPDGAPGEDDKAANCDAKGTDGSDAMRFLAVAGNIEVNNFTLNLGAGGYGGSAETKTDCYPSAAAKGGKGGKSGNFKMISGGDFKISGSFVVAPGRGGDGGHAIATGKDGDGPGKPGADATATGGAGADNNKTLNVEGGVDGVGNVQIASVYGGDGGYATANPGNGGDGKGCGSDGGPGGKGTVTGGTGGGASLSANGATRTPEAEDRGGNGGDATTHGGKGGNGGDCGPTGAGGNGGKGGDATATAGVKGGGTSPNNHDGTTGEYPGGNGGNGGSGCGPGAGGTGGNGKPKGQDGKPGKKICVLPDNSNTGNPPEGGTSNTTGGTSGTPSPTPQTGGHTIGVIKYGGKYIPVSELMVMTHSGCEQQPHWHSLPVVGSPVKTTDGGTVVDPGPECGFGTVASTPVMQIAAP